MLNKYFFKKFALPELKYIAGKRYSNLLILSLILVLSMLAIGLGQGAIKYLEKKMNNPFVSFVNVTLPAGHPFKLKKMEAIHNQSEIEKEKKDINYEKSSWNDYYGFKKPYGLYYSYANFYNPERNVTRTAKVSRAKKDDPIYKQIIEDDQKLENPISSKNEFKVDGWGCIVSLEYLKNDTTKLCFEKNVPFLDFRRNVNGKHEFFKIPIQGFVKSFPDDIDMIVGQKLFSAIEDPDFWRSLMSVNSTARNLQYYATGNDTLLDFWKVNNFVEELEYDNLIYKEGKMFKRNNLSLEDKVSLEYELPKLINTDQNMTHRVLDFYLADLTDKYPNPPPSAPERAKLDTEKFVFEFHAGELSNIEIFNDFLKSKTLHDNKTLEIDLSIIESKKNFDLFNKLAKLLSWALIFFSIFSIVLYITNLIVSHISKNKMNLGTLKAFGLSNNNIILIYSSISITLITISFVISFFVSALLGNLLINLLAEYFSIGDASTLNYISYPIYSLISFFIILPSVFIYLKLWWELRKSTPGDLIYGRE